MTAWLNHETSARVLAGGDLTHWFVETDPFFNDIKIRDMIVEVWAKRVLVDVEGTGKEARIWGVPSGGVRWAKALALRLRDRSLLLTGDYRDAGKTWVVDDVLTTGSTIKDAGADEEPVLVVVHRVGNKMRIASNVTSWMTVKLAMGE